MARSPAALALLALAPVALLAVACGDKDTPSDDTGGTGDPVTGLDHGAVHLCLGSDDPDESFEYGQETWDISGTVVEDSDISDAGLDGAVWGSLVSCSGYEDRGLFLEDADGHTWALGYGLTDADWEAMTPALSVTAGDTLTLRFHAEVDFGTTQAAVLRDVDESLLAAFDDGGWGNAYDPADTPELSVSQGTEVVGEVETGCGNTVAYLTTFATDTESVELEQLETGSVEVDDLDLNVQAVAAWDYTEAECTDVAGAFEWAAWR